MIPEGALRERVCLVTGAARGLGRAIAAAAVARGASVVLADVDESALRETAEELARQGRVEAVPADCATSDGVARAVAAARDAWGVPADALVNNAGVLSHGHLLELTDAEAERVLRINTLGPLLMLREFARALDGHERPGAAVNITSVAARSAFQPGLAAYAATKGALESLTGAAAVELADAGVRVNAVAPGWMRTDMTAGVDRAAALAQRLRGRVPLKRPADPEEVMGAVLFLLSDEAAYITGTTVPVDGGWLSN